MPDITLYQEDVTLLHSMLDLLNRKLYTEGTQHILHPHEYDAIRETERLGNLLLNRTVQRCHPHRDHA